MKTEASNDWAMTSPRSFSSPALSSATTAFTALSACSALAPFSLSMRMPMAGLPFWVVTSTCSPRVTLMSAISPSFTGRPSRQSSTNSDSSWGS